MLRAIAIYEEEKNGAIKQLRKVRMAPAGEMLLSNPSFFLGESVLKNIDSVLLDSNYFQTMQPGKPYIYKPKAGENTYVYQPLTQTYVMVICSKQPLQPVEKAYLFENIGHIYRNPQVGETLNQIIENPQRFTGRDILIDRIQSEIDEIIKIMHENIEIAIKRGEKIEQLEEKALTLSDRAVTFHDRSKKLNSYCCS